MDHNDVNFPVLILCYSYARSYARAETIKLLEKNIRVCSLTSFGNDFLDVTLKAKVKKKQK